MLNKLKQIKKILKYDKFFETSVYNLMLYYEGKKIVKEKLNEKQKQAILELAKIKHEQNKKEAEVWINSGLFNLACEKLVKDKKAERLTLYNENWCYNADIVDVIDCMEEITLKATATGNSEGNNKIDLLREYCGGKI